ncbi:MAG TPA: F0F1 ATP synthase subunit delta [Bacillales bacterium]|nr:F0F1 ATP synthase subunit delta [Bacillales bacterium]
MSEGVAKRYADALYEVAEERGKIEEIENGLASVAEAFREEEIARLWLNPSLDAQRKKELIDSFSGSVNRELVNLLKVVVDNHREHQLQHIAKAYTKIANEARGIVDATVTTAVPLSDEDKEQLAKQFGNALNKKIRIDAKVDRDVIGGVLIRIGNRVYDGSIAGKLSRFKQRLA